MRARVTPARANDSAMRATGADVPALRVACADVPALREGLVSARALDDPRVTGAIDALFDRLLTFSPHVEPSLAEPGLFWLDPNGLEPVHGDLARWTRGVHSTLTGTHRTVSVVAGFQRGRIYALARAHPGPRVLRNAAEEARLTARVPLARLSVLAPALRDELALLGVHTVGDLLRLPITQVRVRYGAEAARVHDFLAGRTWSPLVPRAPAEPVTVEVEIEPPDADPARLLFGLKGALHRAADALAAKHEAIVALEFALHLERPAPDGARTHEERIEAASPTLDVAQLVELVRLRLAAVSLAAPVAHVTATVERTRVYARQTALLCDLTGTTAYESRDLDAAARALARLRASLGHHAVTRARLRDAHLPEARFRYEPVREVRLPRAAVTTASTATAGTGTATTASTAAATAVTTAMPTLARRVFPTPVPLPPVPTHEPERWLGHHGALRALVGPYRVAGGWWSPRGRRERDYYYAETRAGAILWIFYDRPRRAWFLHGIVD